MFDQKEKKNILICKQHCVDYILVAAPFMQISDAVVQFGDGEGRAKVEEAKRNKGKGGEDLPFKSQGVTHLAQYVARTYRQCIALNKEEWEDFHGKGMTVRNPGDQHAATFGYKEDSSGEVEKLWLYRYVPTSGYRVAEIGSDIITRLHTEVLETKKTCVQGSRSRCI